MLMTPSQIMGEGRKRQSTNFCGIVVADLQPWVLSGCLGAPKGRRSGSPQGTSAG